MGKNCTSILPHPSPPAEMTMDGCVNSGLNSSPLLYRPVSPFDNCSFIVNLEIGKCESSNAFVFPFQGCFGYFGLLEFPFEFFFSPHINFKISLSISTKK